MPSTAVARLTQRVSLRAVLWYVLVAAGGIVVTGNVALVVGLASAFLVIETRQLLIDTPGVDNRWVTVGLAVVLLTVSLVWLLAELRQPPLLRTLWAPVAAVLGGVWLLLDARVDLVYDQPRGSSDPVDELDSGVFLLRMLRLNRIVDTLESGPKTVPEIAAASELTEPQVRAAIELAGDDGPIVRVTDPSIDSADNSAIDSADNSAIDSADNSAVDSADDEPVAAGDEFPRYSLDPRQLGVSGVCRMAAGWLARLLRRLARPVLGPA